MRLVMFSLAAMTASTACLGLLFLYALFVPTLPPPTAASSVRTMWPGPPRRSNR